MTHRQAADAILHAGDRVSIQLHRPSNPLWWRASTDHTLSDVPEETTQSESPPPAPLFLPVPPTDSPLLPSTLSFPVAPTDSLPPSLLPGAPPDSLRPPQQSCEHELTQPTFFKESFHSTSEPHLASLLGEGPVKDAHSEPNLLEVTATRDHMFDITLRKGCRGFGFRLDKSKSERKGNCAWEH